MRNDCCTLTIRLSLESSTLLGGDYEFEPYVASQATFDQYRIQERSELYAAQSNSSGPQSQQTFPDQTLIQHDGQLRRFSTDDVREFHLPDLSQMRGSEAIRFRLFARTRYSGQPELDRSDGPCVKREIASGAAVLEIFDIFQLYLQMQMQGKLRHDEARNESSFIVSEKFYDEKLVDYKLRTMLERQGQQPSEQEFNRMYQSCLELTHKAVGHFEIGVRNFNYTQYQASSLSESAMRETRLYARVPSSQKTMGQQRQSLSRGYEPLLYNSRKTWAFMGQAMEAVVADYIHYFVKLNSQSRPLVNASCRAVVNLHLPEYRSFAGPMPVCFYVTCSDPYFREYASAEAKRRDLDLYGFREKTENFFTLMMRSSLRRHGLSEQAFIEAVNSHFDVQNKSTVLEARFMLAEEAMADVGTFCANTAYYTSDVRYMTTRESLQQQGKKGGGDSYKMIMLDSWDNFILNGTSMCDDCDGQAKVVIAVLDSFQIGRVDLQFKWQSPLLQAAQKLRQFTVSQLVGATVSSAYVNNDNEKVDMHETDLPMEGDAMDLRAHNDGHCFILDQPLSATIEMVRQGNADEEVVARMIAANNQSDRNLAFATRDSQRRLLVLEGTGSVDPRRLPLEESYVGQPTLLAKKLTEKRFMQQLRTGLKEKKHLSELFTGEGLAHYSEKQHAKRRADPFYNHVVMGVSGVLKQRFDLSLSQFAYCNQPQKGHYTYGVTMGQLIRQTKESRLALICPFKEKRQQWLESVIPTVEAIQNEMPISAFGRYTDREYAEQIFSKCVSLREMNAQFDYMRYAESSVDKRRRAAFEKMAADVWRDDTLTMVRLYSRCWKMREQSAELADFIESQPGLVSYACFIEKHLPVCEPTLEITCIVRL